MKNRFSKLFLSTMLTTAFLATSATAWSAAHTRSKLDCDQDAVSIDASMSADFEARGLRRKFDASFEAANGLMDQYPVGSMLEVRVTQNGTTTTVGHMLLRLDDEAGAGVNPDIVGDLEFDTNDDGDLFDSAFPTDAAGNPLLMGGNIVHVGGISCMLK